MTVAEKKSKTLIFWSWKDLFIAPVTDNWPKYIHFGDSLEDIKFDRYPHEHPHYKNAIFNNTHLKRLRIVENTNSKTFMDAETLEIASAKLDLNEITFTNRVDVRRETIVQLIKNTKQLN